jgi:phosphoribosyl-ATP pyrophosphohydrolase
MPINPQPGTRRQKIVMQGYPLWSTLCELPIFLGRRQKATNYVNTLGTGFDYFRAMGDSLERLYLAVIAAKDLDPALSRTARLFQRGPAKMAKKLAEEAIEVAIDAVSDNTDAVIRESADLLYNLTVLWASAGIRPEDVWREMDRREHLLGIAEKLPKSASKSPKELANELRAASPAPVARRPIVALESRNLRKRH